MGRARKRDHDLPPRVYLRHGAYYQVIDGKWNNLGRDRTVAIRKAQGRQRAINTKKDAALAEQEGFIYVIGAVGKDSPVKVGIAGSVQRRLADLQTSHHERLEIKGCFLVAPGKARSIERRVHRRLSAARLRGEWFELSVGDFTLWTAIIEENFGPSKIPAVSAAGKIS